MGLPGECSGMLGSSLDDHFPQTLWCKVDDIQLIILMDDQDLGGAAPAMHQDCVNQCVTFYDTGFNYLLGKKSFPGLLDN